MKHFHVRNVHDALPEVLRQLHLSGYSTTSRNGDVLTFPDPVMTTYENPNERVLFWAERDANPFFHLMESLWMMSGSDRVDFPAQFAPNLANYSDDGETFHGAYGHRWREHFQTFDYHRDDWNDVDQIKGVIDLLKSQPDTRRAVIQIWDAATDLGRDSKDLPCNTSVMFRRSPSTGKLDMTVTNRSNDIVWGAYGANAVHFSFLHEFVAYCAGFPLGKYHQFSNDLHAYPNILAQVESLAQEADDVFTPRHLRATVTRNPYTAGKVSPFPIISTSFHEWMVDLYDFMLDPIDGNTEYNDPFFAWVARPMFRAWKAWKHDRAADEPLMHFEYALEEMRQVAASDWRLAGEEWLRRRYKKAQAKLRAADDGVAYP